MEGQSPPGPGKRKPEEGEKALEAKKAEEELKATLRAIVEEAAYARLLNVKLANPQLFLAAAQNILGLYRQLGRKLSEKEIVFILQKIKQRNEKEAGISFLRK